MLRAAILGALADEKPRLVRLKPHVVGATGYQVGLSRQPGYPEAMAHIGRLEGQGYRPRSTLVRSPGYAARWP